MPDPQAMADLLDIVANLYPIQDDAARIAKTAGLEAATIDLSGKPILFWDNVLTEAIRTGIDDDLLGVVLKEYGTNKALRHAYVAYRASCISEARQVELTPKVELKGNTVQIPIGINPVGGATVYLTLVGAATGSNILSPRVRFYISHHPITITQFAVVMRAAGRLRLPEWDEIAELLTEDGDRPALVVWDDAYEFCNYLTNQTGLNCILPTHSQWVEAPHASKFEPDVGEWLDTKSDYVVGIRNLFGVLKRPMYEQISKGRKGQFRCVISA